jgi:hypothetical protein
MAVKPAIDGQRPSFCASAASSSFAAFTRCKIGFLVRHEIGHLDSPVRADQANRKLSVRDELDEEGARDIENVRRLLRRQLRVNGDNGDRVAVRHLAQDFEEELKRLGGTRTDGERPGLPAAPLPSEIRPFTQKPGRKCACTRRAETVGRPAPHADFIDVHEHGIRVGLVEVLGARPAQGFRIAVVQAASGGLSVMLVRRLRGVRAQRAVAVGLGSASNRAESGRSYTGAAKTTGRIPRCARSFPATSTTNANDLHFHLARSVAAFASYCIAEMVKGDGFATVPASTAQPGGASLRTSAAEPGAHCVTVHFGWAERERDVDVRGAA